MKDLFEIKDGRIVEAKFIASPNYNQRPEDMQVDTIVIHNISLPPGEYDKDYVSDFFTNQLEHAAHPYFETIRDKKVSAHLYIRRGGDLIQFVPLHERAWHAGPSRYLNRERVNDFSIGIELEGSDYEPFTEIQYQVLNKVIVTLQENYPGISGKNIVGHSDVAPDRKTDPGPYFEWDKINKGE